MLPLGADPSQTVEAWWSLSPEALTKRVAATDRGLTSDEAARRLVAHGRNAIEDVERMGPGRLLLGQFRSPLILILIFAATVSLAVGEWADASIVLVVVFGSTLLGFVQELKKRNPA